MSSQVPVNVCSDELLRIASMNNAQIFAEGCPRCALLVNVCVIVSGGWQHVFLKSGRGPKNAVASHT